MSMNLSRSHIADLVNLNSEQFGKFTKQTSAVLFFLIGFTFVLTYFKSTGIVPESDYFTILGYLGGIAFAAPFINYFLYAKRK